MGNDGTTITADICNGLRGRVLRQRHFKIGVSVLEVIPGELDPRQSFIDLRFQQSCFIVETLFNKLAILPILRCPSKERRSAVRHNLIMPAKAQAIGWLGYGSII